MIHISKSKIEYKDSYAFLSADVDINGDKQNLYFRVEEEYGEYLLVERMDPFVVLMLPTAIYNGWDIVCDGEVTKDLLYNINDYLIPVLYRSVEKYKPCKVFAQASNTPIKKGMAVGGGFSGGVDSMFNLASHFNNGDGYDITHMAIFNCGPFEGPRYKELFDKAVKNGRVFFEKLNEETGKNLKLLSVDSNITKITEGTYLELVAYRLSGFAMALGKLFSTFLYGGSYPIFEYKIDGFSGDGYLLLFSECFTTEYLMFGAADWETGRLERIKFLKNAPKTIRDHVHVCVHSAVFGTQNCGVCPKCIRTYTAIKTADAVKEFEGSFPKELFDDNWDEILAKCYAYSDNPCYSAVLGDTKVTDKNVLRKAAIYKAAMKAAEKNKEELLEKIKNGKAD